MIMAIIVLSILAIFLGLMWIGTRHNLLWMIEIMEIMDIDPTEDEIAEAERRALKKKI